MAGLPSPDPIPAVHQVLALAELQELDDYERNLLAWHRDALLALKNTPSPQAWLDWYRGLLGAVGQLQSRWQGAKPEPLFARVADENPQAAAVQRVKEAPTQFLQRWNIRIQDQAAAHKATLPAQVMKAPISESASVTHLTFGVDARELQSVTDYALHVVNAWGQDIESKLPDSWQRHLHGAVSAETLSRPSAAPPLWPAARLGIGALPPPTLERRAVRRPTLFATFLRLFQSLKGLGVAIPGILGVILLFLGPVSQMDNSTVQTGQESERTRKAMQNRKETIALVVAGAGALVVLGSIAAAFGMSRRQLTDDLEQIRTDERQRIHLALQAWAAATIEGHKTRLQSLVGAAGGDMKSRTGEWADACWGARRASPSADRPRDMTSALSALGSAKSALAVRVAQLQYDIGALVSPAPSRLSRLPPKTPGTLVPSSVHVATVGYRCLVVANRLAGLAWRHRDHLCKGINA